MQSRAPAGRPEIPAAARTFEKTSRPDPASEPRQRHSLSPRHHLPRRQRGVAVQRPQMFRKRGAGVVQQIALKLPARAVDAHALVNVFPNPFGLPAVVQPNLPVGIPATVPDPAPQILREARKRITVEARRPLFSTARSPPPARSVSSSSASIESIQSLAAQQAAKFFCPA